MIGKQTSPGMNYHLCWLAIMVHNCHIQSSPSSPRSDSSHTTSSPNHPQSNGIVESVVNTTKPLLKKAFKSVHEPQVCFLDHRYTPCWNTKASPLNCWQVHEPNLLCRQETCCLIYPPCTSRLIGRKKMERIRNYYSEKARELPLLKKGDSVRVRPFMPGVPWEKGIVVEPAMTRSYNIEVYGGMLRRKEHTYDMCLSHLSLWPTRKALQKLTKWINGPDRCINLVLLVHQVQRKYTKETLRNEQNSARRDLWKRDLCFSTEVTSLWHSCSFSFLRGKRLLHYMQFRFRLTTMIVK